MQRLLSCRAMSLPNHVPPRSDASDIVLIISADPAAAALLGGLVETLGFTVQFAVVNEPREERRRRAWARIYLIDCATTPDCNDEIIGRAMMRRVAVVLFGPQALMREMRELAARHELELVFTPVDPGPLGDALDRAAGRLPRSATNQHEKP